MADEIKYEYKTVRTVRGTDGLVISRMQRDGWEFVEQAQGTLRTTLSFRRPKKPLPLLLIGAAAVVVVLAGVGIGLGVAFGDEGEQKNESVAAASKKPTPTKATAKAKAAAIDVITSQNTPKFAALLKADNCDEANLAFATKYAGKPIEFNGSIVNMARHGDYKTRYDILVGPGDKGPNTTVGPAFKFDDISLLDLKLTGKTIPATVSEGDKFRFVANVGEFNADQCLFLLDPVSTEVR